MAIFSFIICIIHLTAIVNFYPSTHWQVKPKIKWERIYELSDLDYLYSDMSFEFIQRGNRFVSDAIIENYYKQLTDIKFFYHASKDSNILLPLVNFPGYVAKINSEISKISEQKHMMVLFLPKGSGTVNIYYEGLPIFKVADYLSISSLILIIFAYVRFQNKIK